MQVSRKHRKEAAVEELSQRLHQLDNHFELLGINKYNTQNSRTLFEKGNTAREMKSFTKK